MKNAKSLVFSPEVLEPDRAHVDALMQRIVARTKARLRERTSTETHVPSNLGATKKTEPLATLRKRYSEANV